MFFVSRASGSGDLYSSFHAVRKQSMKHPKTAQGDGQLARASHRSHPAQQESCLTFLVKVWAASLSPSTMVRYGKS